MGRGRGAEEGTEGTGFDRFCPVGGGMGWLMFPSVDQGNGGCRNDGLPPMVIINLFALPVIIHKPGTQIWGNEFEDN